MGREIIIRAVATEDIKRGQIVVLNPKTGKIKLDDVKHAVRETGGKK